MSDADELAKRYLALWADYLAALVADPQAAALLQRWLAVTGQFTKTAGEPGSAFRWSPAPPDRPAADRPAGDRPEADAATAAGASGERDAAVGELARRVAELERRVAALEAQPEAARPRRTTRARGRG